MDPARVQQMSTDMSQHRKKKIDLLSFPWGRVILTWTARLPLQETKHCACEADVSTPARPHVSPVWTAQVLDKKCTDCAVR